MKDPFKHADKTFVVGENRSYIAELPHHSAHKGLPNNVARTVLFKLDSREGNLLTFKHGNGYRTPISGKVLTNLKTGEEICFLDYRGSRIMFEASHYMHGGRRVSQERLDMLRKDDGRTLRQFLKDEAAKPLEERYAPNF
ncbi:MAG: hypothetical protein J6U65_02270 [Bacteroidaceae bacterium]|nr:hypothetical protein [Bacteroidaceae bacterium]